MKALLLAAGYGTRLGAITKCCPKCLIQVGNETMLDHWLYKLDKLGVTDIHRRSFAPVRKKLLALGNE